jgi:hypothetical protein
MVSIGEASCRARGSEGDLLLDRQRDDRAQLLDHLEARLRLARLAGLGLEAVDEGLHVLALGRDLGLLRRRRSPAARRGCARRVVVAGVGDELLLIDVDDVVAHVVQQVADRG